jgi:hypothetical protein
MTTSEFIKTANDLSGFQPYNPTHGALAGGAVGALAGGSLGLASGLLQDDEEQAPWYKRLLTGVALGAGAGALAGGGTSKYKQPRVGADRLHENLKMLAPEERSFFTDHPDGYLKGPLGKWVTDTTLRDVKETAVPWKRTPELFLPKGKEGRQQFDKEIRDYNRPNTERIAAESAPGLLEALMKEFSSQAIKNK